MNFTYTITRVNTHETSIDVIYRAEGYSDLHHKVRYAPQQLAGVTPAQFPAFIFELIARQAPLYRWEQEAAQRVLAAAAAPDLESINMTVTAGEYAALNAAPPVTLEETRATRRAVIAAAAQRAANDIAQHYPPFEQLTWHEQEVEARSFLADPASETPVLSVIAAERDITLDDLAERVIAKADAFRAISALLAGRRQALEDQIEMAQTVEAVQAIAWGDGQSHHP